MKQNTAKYLITLGLLFLCFQAYTQDVKDYEDNNDSFSVLFWNLENFFDYRDEGKSDADEEFSPLGSKRWGKKKFYAKCNAIAKTLMWVLDEYGKLPDVIGFSEVENAFVLRSLLKQPSLKRTSYAIVHYDSKDSRGIDVALLYNTKAFEYLYSEAIPIISGEDTLKTRDILLVTLKHKKGKKYNFIVNHHPSKYLGAQQTQIKRDLAMETLAKIVRNLTTIENLNKNQNQDSLGKRISSEELLIVMGDFNDNSEAPQMKKIEGLLFPKMFQGLDIGTIRYQGAWELIDFFFTSYNLKDKTKMFILKPPFLLEWDNAHSGFKPLRTYSGPRYRGGVSDHLPILLQIF